MIGIWPFGKTCPQCGGKGSFIGVGLNSQAPEGERLKFVEVACRLCAGRRRISRRLLARYLAGQKLKRARIERGMGLRQEAQRLGILPGELADLECGISQGPAG